MAKKGMTIKIDGDNVVYSNISKSKDGYNSARVVVQVGEKEYMAISYEWEGGGVPDFCMDLMGFMKANSLEFSNEKHCKHCKHPVSKCDCMDGPKPLPDDSKETQNPGEKAGSKHCKHCKNPVEKCDCMDGPKPLPDDSKETQNPGEKAKKSSKKENPFAKKAKDGKDAKDNEEEEEDDKKKKDKDKQKKSQKDKQSKK